ncbi:hypothetical protein PtA15_14A387 [Puccinia triticina]|uniref:Uncharacterized protein n=1 Tax=Puccinia triticina TaxID=208348 RepID=A0ABY7D308_9BASI|nr:uncharacterized protein PtA15_14A387 [Puccinia triticina]WAQ91503.1 hypothetical protein PtA15_14A387 [Puccinia triticina]
MPPDDPGDAPERQDDEQSAEGGSSGGVDEEWIRKLVDGVVAKIPSAGGTSAMETDVTEDGSGQPPNANSGPAESGGSTLSSHQQNGPEGAPSSHQSGEAHKISKTPPPQDPQRDTWGSSPHNHDSPAGNKMAIDKTTPPCPRTTPDPLVPETNGLLARPNNDKEEIVPPAATHSAAHALEPQPANPADQDAQPSTVSNNAGHAPPAPTSATQGTAPADSMEKGQDDTSTLLNSIAYWATALWQK